MKISIHSISTVGIRQHFNQDYLLHEDRTDFTGSNGSGKSIIADLFQVIFIANKRYIKFGTDSKKRDIHTIPYRDQNEAYAFLNIRIEENQYIAVGVCISSKTGVALKPFIITSHTDLDLNIEDNTFSTPLVFNDFLASSGRVQNLKELARHLNKEKGLKLTSFVHAENLDKYYDFLYQKDVLPINLSKEDSLKSFATVIQSFSRATNLRLKSSRDLKDFLFESEEENLIGEYNRHKVDLLRLMKDFRKLKEKMDALEGKQKALTTLKQKNDQYEQVLLDQSRMEVLFHYYKKEEAEKNKVTIETTLTSLESTKEKLEKEEASLQLIVDSKESEKNYIDERSDQLSELIELENELTPIVEEIAFWKEIKFSEISSEDKKTLAEQEAKSDLKSNQLKEVFDESNCLLKTYGSYSAVLVKRQKQRKRLEAIKSELQEESDRKNKLLVVLNKADEQGLMNQVLTWKKELSLGQETVFMSLLELGFKKPKNPKKGSRYINGNDILNEEFITEDPDNNGVWLNLGRISEFIEKKNEKRLFADPNAFSTELYGLKGSVQKELTSVEIKLNEIEKIQDGKPYDKEILKEDFDLRLTDNALIGQLKTAMILFLKKDNIIDELEIRNKEKIQLLNSLNEKLKLKEGDNKSELLKQLNEQRRSLDQQWKEANKLLNEAKRDLALNNQKLNIQTENYQSEKQTLELLKNSFNESKDNFEDKYPNIDTSFIRTSTFIDSTYDDLNADLKEGKKAYRNEYIAVVNAFDETKNKADVGINLQIDSDTFNFLILESTLLGPRVKHLDNIKPEMDEMNRTRLEFVDDLYEKMIKIFSKTEDQYKKFEAKVKDLNGFFKDKKISEQYYFSIDFSTEKCLDINWIYALREKSSQVFMKGEIPFGESTDDFIEKFFNRIAKHRERVSLTDLLNPKSYFHLSTKMVDENGVENSGSTGETYTALVLLGIARLSLVQNKNKGLKFIILEESSNLDDTNFNLFPKIAKEYHYQIITMTPKPFGSDSAEGWYLHQLIKGKKNKDLNYPIPASYFKTKNARRKLSAYIKEVNT
tara:strand:- start:3616 stop:6762 length:3147 start_codon:yes stop_codon:yes gene_type:complete